MTTPHAHAAEGEAPWEERPRTFWPRDRDPLELLGEPGTVERWHPLSTPQRLEMDGPDASSDGYSRYITHHRDTFGSVATASLAGGGDEREYEAGGGYVVHRLQLKSSVADELNGALVAATETVRRADSRGLSISNQGGWHSSGNFIDHTCYQGGDGERIFGAAAAGFVAALEEAVALALPDLAQVGSYETSGFNGLVLPVVSLSLLPLCLALAPALAYALALTLALVMAAPPHPQQESRRPTRAWLNENRAGAYNTAHAHGLGYSGVYYVRLPGETAVPGQDLASVTGGCLVLRTAPTGAADGGDGGSAPTPAAAAPVSSAGYNVGFYAGPPGVGPATTGASIEAGADQFYSMLQPCAGMLVLFPSHLLHAVFPWWLEPGSEGGTSRISIAFNI